MRITFRVNPDKIITVCCRGQVFATKELDKSFTPSNTHFPEDNVFNQFPFPDIVAVCRCFDNLEENSSRFTSYNYERFSGNIRI